MEIMRWCMQAQKTRKKGLDKKNLVGALITDLLKAFDCLNHELLIAKMEAYGFNKESLFYISSYL